MVEKIRMEIISGGLNPGERIPSVRELALAVKVNPNTMQKALVELESEGLLYTERTNGKFVTDNQALINKMKEDLARDKVNLFLEDMKKIGISHEEAIQYLQEIGGHKE